MSLAVLLLSHIRRVFGETGTDRLPTPDLLRGLVELEEGPWARWWAADVAAAERIDGPAPRRAGADLSHQLKPLHKSDGQPIKPRVFKTAGRRTARGYLLEDFEDAFRRYLGSRHVTNATDVTLLASAVTSVSSVTSPSPKDPDLDEQGEFIRAWNDSVYEEAADRRAENEGQDEDGPGSWAQCSLEEER
jgi:hypothetical protein